jgi:Domain of unknown function (DUF4476)
MKTRLLIFSSLLLLSLITFSQNKVNLVVFAEDGDKFYAYVNGIKQNNTPESNVKVTGVTPNISLRIEFEDKALPQLKQNMALEPGFEHTAKIKRDMKKQLKLRYFGQTPLEETTTSNVPTVAYHTAETTDNGTLNTVNNGGNNTTVTTTSTTTQINNGSNPNNTSINVNMAGVGINMNVSGMDNGTTTTSQTTSYTTTTSSSSTSSNSQPVKNNTASNQQVVTTNVGCKSAMTQANFETMKKSVESKPFSDTKMSTAKIATKNNCLSVNQVKEISKLFSMDEDKLAYAKFAYDYCVDKGNYFQVSEVFSFSTTTDEFNEFLEKH